MTFLVPRETNHDAAVAAAAATAAGRLDPAWTTAKNRYDTDHSQKAES